MLDKSLGYYNIPEIDGVLFMYPCSEPEVPVKTATSPRVFRVEEDPYNFMSWDEENSFRFTVYLRIMKGIKAPNMLTERLFPEPLA